MRRKSEKSILTILLIHEADAVRKSKYVGLVVIGITPLPQIKQKIQIINVIVCHLIEGEGDAVFRELEGVVGGHELLPLLCLLS